MNRKVIVTLIVFMVLVMTSLILVQTNSLTKTFAIREEQFDQTVSRILKRVIDRLEYDEASRILSGQHKAIKNRADFFPTSPEKTICQGTNLRVRSIYHFFIHNEAALLFMEMSSFNIRAGSVLARLNADARVSSLPPLISFTIRTIILRNNTNSA
jgi:hypothetical protein